MTSNSIFSSLKVKKGGERMNFTGCEGFLAADPKVFWNERGEIGSCYYTLVNNDRKCEKPDYISCIAYGKNAEIANHYFKKGFIGWQLLFEKISI